MHEEKDVFLICGDKKLHFLFAITTFDHMPIFSVLKDDNGQLYICLTSDMRWCGRFIVGETNKEVVHGVLKREITVNDALKAVDNMVYVAETEPHEISAKFKLRDINQVDPLYLASPGTYIDNEWSDEEICDLEGYL